MVFSRIFDLTACGRAFPWEVEADPFSAECAATPAASVSTRSLDQFSWSLRLRTTALRLVLPQSHRQLGGNTALPR